MKRGKKILSIFQINLLVISLFAFCFVINLEFVDAAKIGQWVIYDKRPTKVDSSNVAMFKDYPGHASQSAAWKKISAGTGGGTSSTNTPVSTGKFPKGIKIDVGGISKKYSGVRTVTDESSVLGYKVEVKDSKGGAYREATPEETSAFRQEGIVDFETGDVKGEKSFLGNFFTAQEGSFTAGILSGLEWAGAVVGVLGIVGGLLPEGYDWVNSATIALGVGAFLYGGLTEWNAGNEFVGGDTGAAVISIAASAIVFYLLYEEIETEMITFTCSPWDAPAGGMYCEKCNEQNLPCSEYQCRSLGQACELINPGTDEAKCVWVNKNDVTFPIIKPWDDALSDGYAYSPDSAINPPDSGVQILHSKKECVGAFEKLSFGVILDEPAKCKIDYLRKNNFDEMSFYFGGSPTLKYNHTQTMSLPGSNSEENLTLKNDGNYELYVRCQDANGNYNKGNFVFKYCVDAGPDTTAPLIVTTNVLNGMPVKYNEDSLDLEVYINEPAQCKWSHSDQQYDDMEETMSCSSSITEMNSRQLYKCETTLTGLKNDEENNFYFKCKDQPTKPESERNTNAESYEFTLIGTQPLVINEVGPNETVSDASENVRVVLTAETSAGYNEGIAICYYSATGDEDDYIKFFNTNSYTHSQDLYLPEGDYEYFIKCVDLGGNSDEKTTYFEVESDSSAPMIVRTFHEDSYLKLITNEDAECVYDTVNCNYLFDDGISITSTNKRNHFVDWNTETALYVKCKDEYGNQPAPNECSINVRPITRYY